MLVVIVFLQSWRTALIPIVAIPVSLIGTFAVMAALGFSLNTLTLFGLVLAIGIVVDDAIVVVENVERNIALGMTPREAAHRTMDEVGTALIAIALVLAAVFVPTAFIPGISGQFYRQFALTIAVSTLISAFISLTLSPALAPLLLKPHDRASLPRNPPGAVAAAGWPAASTAASIATAIGYAAQRRQPSPAARSSCCAIYAGLLAGTVYMANAVPRGFIPQLDQGYAIVVVQLPDGASLSRTDAVVQRASKIMRRRRASSTPSPSPASPAPPSPTPPTPPRSSPASSPSRSGCAHGQSGTSAHRRSSFGRLQSIEEAFIIAIPPPPVRGIGNAGGFKMQLQERVDASMLPRARRPRAS